MSVYAHITNVQEPAHREALKEVARRLATIERVNPTEVTPTLSSNLDANGQKISNLAASRDANDLVTLADVRGHVQARLSDFFKSIQGLATPLT